MNKHLAANANSINTHKYALVSLIFTVPEWEEIMVIKELDNLSSSLLASYTTLQTEQTVVELQ